MWNPGDLLYKNVLLKGAVISKYNSLRQKSLFKSESKCFSGNCAVLKYYG